MSDGAKNDNTAGEQPILKSVTEDTSENLPTIRHEDETITGARRNVNSGADYSIDESSISENFEDALTSPDTSAIPLPTETSQKDVNSEIRTEVDSDKSAEVDIAGGSKGEEAGEETPQKDVNSEIRTNEVDSDKSAEVGTAGGLKEEEPTAEKSDNGEYDKAESRDVFDDTIESSQNKVPTTDEDEHGGELCIELYRLLENEGQKLTREVMTVVITRETGKSVKTLLNNLTDLVKSKLNRVLPEESHRILESKEEHNTSFQVLYGLHQIFLDEKHHPKSGWGNPVRITDIGIGDDVERLYRIFTIINQEISNPVTVSAEGYVRLLDLIMRAITRLDPDVEFKEDFKALVNKLTSIKNSTLIQKMIKTVGWIKLK